MASLRSLLPLLTTLAFLACAAPVATPDIAATVIASIPTDTPVPTPTPDIEATVRYRMDATVAAISTPTPIAIPTATPAPTHVPIPTATPTPTPTPTLTPTPLPTPTKTILEMMPDIERSVVRIITSDGSGSGFIVDSRYSITEGGEDGNSGDNRSRGFMPDATGGVITNAHVVDHDRSVEVVLYDGRTVTGRVVGINEYADLAYVSLQLGDSVKNIRPLALGNPLGISVGQEVMAVGFPLSDYLGGQMTVTKGIISAIQRRGAYQMLQTDSPVNSGNSGGPLIDMRGNVVGVVTSKLSINEIEGVGFALHLSELMVLLDRLRYGEKHMLPTPTPTPRPTATPTRTPRPTATPTPRPTFTPRPTATPQIRREFGPISGELRHDPMDGFIETRFAGASIVNMVVEATFVNPYSSASNPWDYGFIFRDNRNERDAPFIVIAVNYLGGWVLWTGDGTSDASYDRVDSGTLGRFNTRAGGRNHLRIVAIGKRGWFFVDDEFVSTLDLSNVTHKGDVAAILGVFGDTEQVGEVTRYEGFQGRELTTPYYGSKEGQLRKRPGFIAEHESGVWTRDLVTEAEFINPRGSDWDYGFIIRRSVRNRLDVIGVTDYGRWFHKTRDVGDEKYTEVANAWLDATGADLHSRRNHMLLLAFGDSGWLFLNDRLVAKLDLSHNLDSGDVRVMSDFFHGHDGSPKFEGFHVWTP